MIKQIRYLAIGGFLAFAPAGFAQLYNMTFTGEANGNNYGGVYVSPYTGTITGNGVNYSGDMICDDYTTDVVGNWTATAVNAADVNSSVKFSTVSYQGHTYQQDYDAVAYLANELISDMSNSNAQIDISYAIWEIMDPSLTSTYDGSGSLKGPDGDVPTWISSAFTAIQNPNNIYTNVTVFTPSPNQNASQEFLVVGGGPNGGPLVPTPEPASAAILGLDLLSAFGVVLLVRRYRVRS